MLNYSAIRHQTLLTWRLLNNEQGTVEHRRKNKTKKNKTKKKRIHIKLMTGQDNQSTVCMQELRKKEKKENYQVIVNN